MPDLVDIHDPVEENDAVAEPAGWRMRIVKGAPHALLALIFGSIFATIAKSTYDIAQYLPVLPRWVVKLEEPVWIVTAALWLGYPVAMTVLALALGWLRARRAARPAVCGAWLWMALSLVVLAMSEPRGPID